MVRAFYAPVCFLADNHVSDQQCKALWRRLECPPTVHTAPVAASLHWADPIMIDGLAVLLLNSVTFAIAHALFGTCSVGLSWSPQWINSISGLDNVACGQSIVAGRTPQKSKHARELHYCSFLFLFFCLLRYTEISTLTKRNRLIIYPFVPVL